MSTRIEKLKDAVQVMHGCFALHAAAVPVCELFGEKVEWEGVVEVLTSPTTPRPTLPCLSYLDNREHQFVTVLEMPPVVSSKTAFVSPSPLKPHQQSRSQN